MSWNPTNQRSRVTSWMPEWLHLLCRVSLRLALIAVLLLSLVASYYYYKSSQFDIRKVAEQQLQNTYIDHNGYPIVYPASQQARLITKDDLPPHLVDALIAREDSSFDRHCGVDFRGLARASARNLKDLSFTQGASTLTMQLARNTYNIRAKSLNRKFLEIALTLRIEQHYSKAEIMAYYLNKIYFGSGCYGIEQAAQKYFKKSTRQLDLSEAATLAGIIRGPHIFSPLRNLDAAEQQRNQVLNRMVSIGKVSAAQADLVKQTPLVLPTSSAQQKTSTQATNGYCRNALDRHLRELLEEKDIKQAGITIQSSLDIAMIHRCEKDLEQLLKNAKDKDLQAACVVLNHKTGGVRVAIGGADQQKSTPNRALDWKADLGNAFTPYIYSAALERGKLPIKGKPVQTGKQLKPEETLRIAKRFGLSRPFNERGIFYGSGVATPLELATAFATLGNGGQRPHTFFVKHIVTTEQTSLFSNEPAHSSAVLPGTAKETLRLLKRKKKTYQHTTDAFKGRALWSCATQGEHTAVLWLGYDETQPVRNRRTLLREMEELTYKWVNQ